MIDYFFFALWFFLPAGVANVAPVFAIRIRALKKLGTPVDGDKTFAGKRILGDHKTWRGFLAGIVMATLVVLLQMFLYHYSDVIRATSMQVNYDHWWMLALGPLFGFGALFGDSVKSFFKRQAGVPSGHSWFPFDQVDYVLGGLFFASLIVNLTWQQYVATGLIWTFIHPLGSFAGWLMGMKDKPI